jgi:hypothetical protein
VDSFGGWDARARVDVDDFSNGVRMDEIAGNYQVICMPLRKAMLLAVLEANVTMPSCHTAACGGASVLRLTMSSGSSGRSETCSSSNSLGICRDTSFMVSL